MHVGLPEIIFVLLLVLLIFGTKKLPDAARSIGKALTEFKRGIREMKEDVREDADTHRENNSDRT